MKYLKEDISLNSCGSLKQLITEDIFTQNINLKLDKAKINLLRKKFVPQRRDLIQK